MNVTRAARQIVNALIARKQEIELTAMAHAAARVYGAFPEPSLKALELVNEHILPSTPEPDVPRKGSELHKEQPATFKAITYLGFGAADSQNQN